MSMSLVTRSKTRLIQIGLKQIKRAQSSLISSSPMWPPRYPNCSNIQRPLLGTSQNLTIPCMAVDTSPLCCQLRSTDMSGSRLARLVIQCRLTQELVFVARRREASTTSSSRVARNIVRAPRLSRRRERDILSRRGELRSPSTRRVLSRQDRKPVAEVVTAAASWQHMWPGFVLLYVVLLAAHVRVT